MIKYGYTESPSLIGIMVSFLFIFKFVQSMYSREVGLLSVFFLALSFLTISEIHQAKQMECYFFFINYLQYYNNKRYY